MFIKKVIFNTLMPILLLSILSITSPVEVSAGERYESKEDLQERQIILSKKLLQKIPSAFADGDELVDILNIGRYPRKKVIATGYTAGIESTGKSPGDEAYGVTYSGIDVKRDLYSTIAADLTVFPLGTILYIPNYGYGVVTDKGGAIKGNKIDLYFQTVEDVYAQWGKKELDIFIIKLGSGEITDEELARLNENSALQVFRQQIVK